jgi:hypothetical protein
MSCRPSQRSPRNGAEPAFRQRVTTSKVHGSPLVAVIARSTSIPSAVVPRSGEDVPAPGDQLLDARGVAVGLPGRAVAGDEAHRPGPDRLDVVGGAVVLEHDPLEDAARGRPGGVDAAGLERDLAVGDLRRRERRHGGLRGGREHRAEGLAVHDLGDAVPGVGVDPLRGGAAVGVADVHPGVPDEERRQGEDDGEQCVAVHRHSVGP